MSFAQFAKRISESIPTVALRSSLATFRQGRIGVFGVQRCGIFIRAVPSGLTVSVGFCTQGCAALVPRFAAPWAGIGAPLRGSWRGTDRLVGGGKRIGVQKSDPDCRNASVPTVRVAEQARRVGKTVAVSKRNKKKRNKNGTKTCIQFSGAQPNPGAGNIMRSMMARGGNIMRSVMATGGYLVRA